MIYSGNGEMASRRFHMAKTARFVSESRYHVCPINHQPKDTGAPMLYDSAINPNPVGAA